MKQKTDDTQTDGPLLFAFKGAQGSGKGTQAELLEAALRARGHKPKVLTMSKILEETGDPDVRRLMEDGKPVPCSLLKPLFEAPLRRAIEEEGCDAVITDGYPRYTDQQVDDFADLTRRFRCRTLIVRIRAEPDLCRRRIVQRAQEMLAAGLSPRADDLDPAAVERRLSRYFATKPFVTRRLLSYHRFRHVTVTAKERVSKEELHRRLAREIWPPALRHEEVRFGTVTPRQRSLVAA